MAGVADLLEQSTTYQATLRKGEAGGEARGVAQGEARGRAEGMQEVILMVGRNRFGPPSDDVVQRIRAAADLAELAKWTDRLLTVEGWDALLDT